jgi:SAM-dependent methyltransferase
VDPHLVLAYKLSRLAIRPIEAFFVTELSETELQRIFQPWSDWCRVYKLHDCERPTLGVLCLADPANESSLVKVRALGSQSFLTVLDSGFEGLTGLDRAFVQEISHHDFEIGGKNEWDGAPVKHSPHILRLLSEVHCRDYFPMSIWPELMERQRLRGEHLQALDVGCGPLSWLRYGALQNLLTVTGVDPLLDAYDIVLARHGLSGLNSIRPAHRIVAQVESLPDVAPQLEHRFDFIWTNNALDHIENPDIAVRAMAFALRADGFAIVQVATNEGTRQRWTQLHRFDIDLRGDHVIATDREGRCLPLIGPGCALRLSDVLEHSGQGLSVIARVPLT